MTRYAFAFYLILSVSFNFTFAGFKKWKVFKNKIFPCCSIDVKKENKPEPTITLTNINGGEGDNISKKSITLNFNTLLYRKQLYFDWSGLKNVCLLEVDRSSCSIDRIKKRFSRLPGCRIDNFQFDESCKNYHFSNIKYLWHKFKYWALEENKDYKREVTSIIKVTFDESSDCPYVIVDYNSLYYGSQMKLFCCNYNKIVFSNVDFGPCYSFSLNDIINLNNDIQKACKVMCHERCIECLFKKILNQRFLTKEKIYIDFDNCINVRTARRAIIGVMQKAQIKKEMIFMDKNSRYKSKGDEVMEDGTEILKEDNFYYKSFVY